MNTIEFAALGVLVFGPMVIRQWKTTKPGREDALTKVERKKLAEYDSLGTEWSQDHFEWEYVKNRDGTYTKKSNYIS